jgi:hypothetical protein
VHGTGGQSIGHGVSKTRSRTANLLSSLCSYILIGLTDVSVLSTIRLHNQRSMYICNNVEANNRCARCYRTVASGHDSPDMQLQRELLCASRYICRTYMHVTFRLSARNGGILVSIRRNSLSARCVNNDSQHKNYAGPRPCPFLPYPRNHHF